MKFYLLRRPTGLIVALGLAGFVACAPKAPSVVLNPQYPDYLFPTIPTALADGQASERHMEAWRFFQIGDLLNSHRRFTSVLEGASSFYPAMVGLGYIELVRRDYEQAGNHFGLALTQNTNYVPALVGRGEVLLGLNQIDSALQSFEEALAVEPALVHIRQRVQILRFDRLQEQIALARQAFDSGQYAQSRSLYERAISESPESSFLHVELGRVYFEENDLTSVLVQAKKAVELDPEDVSAIMLRADVSLATGELEVAEKFYMRAQLLEPNALVNERLKHVRMEFRLAALPPEYWLIPEVLRITRAQLAALLGFGFEQVLEDERSGQTPIITDMREHWAGRWVILVAEAGVMDVNLNYTFQPDVNVERGELGEVLSRLLDLLLPGDQKTIQQDEISSSIFEDIGPGHLSYSSASRVIANGILPVLEGNTYQPTRTVSGVEVLAAIERLEELVNGTE